MHPARILCPVDFSDASRHAIDQVIVMAGYYKSCITALHVRGRNPVDMALFGSTANQVVRRVTSPVLTLRR